MAKASGKKKRRSSTGGTTRTLSPEEVEKLAARPLKEAKKDFEDLARWRTKSLASGLRI